MFHLASVIVWALIQPLNLVGLLVAATVVTALFRWRRLSVSLGVLALAVLTLSAWTTLGALLLHPLESRFARPDTPPAAVDGIIVLGGGFEGSINAARGGYELNSSGDRFVEAAVLARRYPDARLVVAGGSGAVFLTGEGDGQTAPRLLRALGVAKERLVLEKRSRDTYENAVETKRLVTPRPGETWLLVTSAFHMPRAIGTFRAVDFAVEAWPADYRTAGTERPGLAADNAIDSLENTTVALREWLALAAYRFTGRTGTLLPAPDPSAR